MSSTLALLLGGRINVNSEKTNDVETVLNTREELIGVAWDAMGQQLYFSSYFSPSKIFRLNADGMEVVAVLSSSSCKL